MIVVSHIQVIRILFPEARESELVERLQMFDKIVQKNKGANMARNRDYSEGYNIGEYLNASGEDLDFKDLDQYGNEILEEISWEDLPVDDIESFKDGLSNGYTISNYREQK